MKGCLALNSKLKSTEKVISLFYPGDLVTSTEDREIGAISGGVGIVYTIIINQY